MPTVSNSHLYIYRSVMQPSKYLEVPSRPETMTMTLDTHQEHREVNTRLTQAFAKHPGSVLSLVGQVLTPRLPRLGLPNLNLPPFTWPFGDLGRADQGSSRSILIARSSPALVCSFPRAFLPSQPILENVVPLPPTTCNRTPISSARSEAGRHDAPELPQHASTQYWRHPADYGVLQAVIIASRPGKPKGDSKTR